VVLLSPQAKSHKSLSGSRRASGFSSEKELITFFLEQYSSDLNRRFKSDE
jgi:hypothetical protein